MIDFKKYFTKSKTVTPEEEPLNILKYRGYYQRVPRNWNIVIEENYECWWLMFKLAFGKSEIWHPIVFWNDSYQSCDLRKIKVGFENPFIDHNKKAGIVDVDSLKRQLELKGPGFIFENPTHLSSFSYQNFTPYQAARIAQVLRVVCDGGYRFEYLAENYNYPPSRNLSMAKQTPAIGQRLDVPPQAFISLEGSSRFDSWLSLWDWDEFTPEKMDSVLRLILRVREYSKQFW